jgi:dephospho-CoA kinase
MIKVGLIGGIGTGKTTIAKAFAALVIPIFEADKAAKYLIENDAILKTKIKTLFGSEAYLASGKYNNTFIASQVYGNTSLLEKLNSLVHPAVGVYFEQWLLQQQAAPYIIREAAIITENHGLDKIIVVKSPLALRMARIQKRDPKRSLEQVNTIISNQKSEEEYEAFADYIIENNEEVSVIEQVLEVDGEIKKISR